MIPAGEATEPCNKKHLEVKRGRRVLVAADQRGQKITQGLKCLIAANHRGQKTTQKKDSAIEDLQRGDWDLGGVVGC